MNDLTAAPEAPSAPALQYDGKLSPIARMWAGNLLLFLLTLSFYRFWGRTRIRQYVWNHIAIFGDRLEYTGTGKELCIGFLITLPIYGLLVLISKLTNEDITLVPILFLGYFAVFSGYRYRVTRTSWRAIRSHFPLANSNNYSLFCLKRAFYNFITAGLLIPKSDVLKWQALVKNFSIGNIQAEYDATAKGLMTPHIFSALIGGAVYGFIFGSLFGISEFFMKNHEFTSEEERRNTLFGFTILALLVASPAFYVIRQWYTGALVRRKFSGIRLGSVSTSCHFTVRRYMGFKLVNMLILIFTLGLGGAFILHRKARFFCRYITFNGQPDAIMIQQMTEDKTTFAEGFMDAFGIDLAFLS